MGKTGRWYSPEFKQEVVRLAQASDEKHPALHLEFRLDKERAGRGSGYQTNMYQICGGPAPSIELSLHTFWA
jgi:hypothetical protein